jgi:hypothetical protein
MVHKWFVCLESGIASDESYLFCYVVATGISVSNVGMFPVVVRARHSLFSPSTTAYTTAAASKRQHNGQATSESIPSSQPQQQPTAVGKTSPAAAAVAAVESNKVPTSFNVF